MEQVIFLKDHDQSTVFAFFTEPEYGEYVCYCPIGGHSGCHLGYASACEEATEAEYLPILKQLISYYGYNIEVVKKDSFDWDMEKWYRGYYLSQG
jgi:hypothetical protein